MRAQTRVPVDAIISEQEFMIEQLQNYITGAVTAFRPGMVSTELTPLRGSMRFGGRGESAVGQREGAGDRVGPRREL